MDIDIDVDIDIMRRAARASSAGGSHTSVNADAHGSLCARVGACAGVRTRACEEADSSPAGGLGDSGTSGRLGSKTGCLSGRKSSWLAASQGKFLQIDSVWCSNYLNIALITLNHISSQPSKFPI